MSHEPKFFNVPDCLQRVFDSPEFAAAAKEAAQTVEDFRAAVTRELKRLTEEQRREELRNYEELLGAKALTAASAKFKGDVEGELKKLVARHRSAELEAHERDLAKRALSAAKKKSAA